VPLDPALQRARRNIIRFGMVALPAYALYRGGRNAGEQYRRMRENQSYRTKDLSQPMPNLTVKESYAKFANEKLAGAGDPMNESYFRATLPREMLAGSANGMGRGLGDALGDILIRKPFDFTMKHLKNQYHTIPAQNRALEQALQDDDILSGAERRHIDRAHGTLRSLAPGLAKDPNFVRGYMRSAVMSGGVPDLATIKLLLEAEKLKNQVSNPGKDK